ncbi:MAG TPA: acyl-CoA dehydrogenase [Actinocrinis sp.]|uniref:acyl-CoA dehydrogenase n=1 Tax=Actinocrinis sp. TaxID=1920516 RepID=UPI002D548F68|nr:acyl-CoA dehydrogenase [Actinocrinis sp.]HZU55679.1 acyl-CoA dehydrogenase [Actinocrinis sp.]
MNLGTVSSPPAAPPLGAQARADDLERRFGPMADPANPLGLEAVLTADDHWEVLGEAEALLDDFGMGAEFVPARLGGRFERLDLLGRTLRPVFRRDPSLGFGYGLSSFIAAAPVWFAGTDAQQRWVADLLLSGGRIAVARRGEPHANDFVRDEIAADVMPDGFLLNGTKTVIANADRARGLVVFARVDDRPTARSHSLLLLDRERLPAECVEDLPRYPTVGMRGCHFGGLEIVECPVPADCVIGEPYGALELSLRSSLLIRGLVPATLIACGDTALRTAVRYAVDNRRGGAPLRTPHARAVVVGAFLDLLLSDCLTLVAARAAHLLPDRMSASAAAAAYLAPKVLTESCDDLTVILGDAQYHRFGAYGMFQKQLRDIPVMGLGHAGSAARQATIIPQLPLFARADPAGSKQPPVNLFRASDPLPPLELGELEVLGEADPLAASLPGAIRELLGGDVPGVDEAERAALREVAGHFDRELSDLRKACAALAGRGHETLSTPFSYALADRYALLCAAAACLGVWRAQTDHCDGAGNSTGDPFLADPAWLLCALGRIGGRLGLPATKLPAASSQRLLDEVFARFTGERSYDLYNSPLASASAPRS